MSAKYSVEHLRKSFNAGSTSDAAPQACDCGHHHPHDWTRPLKRTNPKPHVHTSACACGQHHSHAKANVNQLVIGILLLINSVLCEWILEGGIQVGALSAMLSALILGAPILMAAIKDLRQGTLSTNELVALALLASFASANYREAAIISFFMLLGQIIEARTAEGALASIEALIKITPNKARRVIDNKEEEVFSQNLAIGDIIRVRPGDNIAADGVILGGQSSINQANITGESLPVDRKAGEEVFAGTVNLTGVLEIKVTRAGSDTTLGRVRELILAAEKTKLPIMRIIDQYMAYYTPLVLVIGGLVWAFTQDMSRVISLFIVSCPCAFVLATPTAMVAALSAAARLGILIKNIGAIELAAKINAFVFDKTGTLTSGNLAVSRLAPVEGVSAAELLRIAASAEKYSNHPTAKAVVLLAGEANVPLVEPKNFSETPGRGVSAEMDGTHIFVGRAQWLCDNGISENFSQTVDLNETEGWSLIFVAKEGKCIGWIGLQDQIRKEAAQCLGELKENGVRRLALVSGDRRSVAESVAKEIHCDEVIADCLPQDKVTYVRGIRAKGYCVAVVGDGVNDAPALAAGDLGIAMGAAGSDVAIHSATIALMNNDLRRLPFLIRLSRQTRAVINQNFLLGLFFVIGGLFLAAAKFINPIVAAIFHVAGSLVIVFNSFRLMRFGEELAPHEAISTQTYEQRNSTTRVNATPLAQNI